jgi:hypothetical protein
VPLLPIVKRYLPARQARRAVRIDFGWLHVTRLNANRRYAKGRFDLIACIHADSVDHGLEYTLNGSYTSALRSTPPISARASRAPRPIAEGWVKL